MPKVAQARRKKQSNVIAFPSPPLAPQTTKRIDLHDIVCPTGGKVAYCEGSPGVLVVTTPEGTWWLIKQEAA